MWEGFETDVYGVFNTAFRIEHMKYIDSQDVVRLFVLQEDTNVRNSRMQITFSC